MHASGSPSRGTSIYMRIRKIDRIFLAVRSEASNRSCSAAAVNFDRSRRSPCTPPAGRASARIAGATNGATNQAGSRSGMHHDGIRARRRGAARKGVAWRQVAVTRCARSPRVVVARAAQHFWPDHCRFPFPLATSSRPVCLQLYM
jgi:hypothetical protein